MIRAYLLALLMLPIGCGVLTEPDEGADESRGTDGSDAVILVTDRSLYGPGDTAVVRLINGSDEPVGYNLCFSAREFWTGIDWRRIEPLRLCAAVLYTLAPGEEAMLQEPIATEWEPGRYRMVTTLGVLRGNSRTEVFTEPFDVVP